MEIPESFFDVSFNKAVAFGYKTEDVDEFVTKALRLIKELQEENEVLQEKMTVLATSLEKYREEEDSLRSALIGAQKLGDSILKDSKNKAEIIIRDATTKAGHIIEDAHIQLEHEKEELERVKLAAADFKEGLIRVYKAHLDQIKYIPVDDATAKKQQERKVAAEQAAASKAKVQAQEAEEEEQAEPEQEEEIPEEAIVRKAAESRPAPQPAPQQPEEEEEDEEEFQQERRPRVPRHEAEYEDDDDEEEEDFQIPTRKKRVVSSKYGVLKFGDSFDLQDD